MYAQKIAREGVSFTLYGDGSSRAVGVCDSATTLMFRTILNNLGFDLDGKAVREILDDLLEEGFFKLSRNARNPHGFWKPSPYVRRYQRASISCDGAGDWDDPFSDRLTRSMAFFASIAAPFEACAKKPL